jgi:hypothetical protein
VTNLVTHRFYSVSDGMVAEPGRRGMGGTVACAEGWDDVVAFVSSMVRPLKVTPLLAAL